MTVEEKLAKLNEDLKQCPFCGGIMKAFAYPKDEGEDGNVYVFSCTGGTGRNVFGEAYCGIKTDAAINYGTALTIKGWLNKRGFV